MVFCCPRRKLTEVELCDAPEYGDDDGPKGLTEIAGQLLRDLDAVDRGEAALAMPRKCGKYGLRRCVRRLLALTLALTAAVILTPTFAILARHLHRRLGLWRTIDACGAARVCASPGGVCALHAADADGAELLDDPPLMGFLYAQVANESVDTMSEILRGAHVEITDPDMSSYRFLAGLAGAYERKSSHHSDAATMGIHLGGHLNTILFGTLGHRTWLQFEGADEKAHPMEHTLDFWEYKITWRNVGPLGTSWFTDGTPLTLGKIEALDSACPAACTELAKVPTGARSGDVSRFLGPHEHALTT